MRQTSRGKNFSGLLVSISFSAFHAIVFCRVHGTSVHFNVFHIINFEPNCRCCIVRYPFTHTQKKIHIAMLLKKIISPHTESQVTENKLSQGKAKCRRREGRKKYARKTRENEIPFWHSAVSLSLTLYYNGIASTSAQKLHFNSVLFFFFSL